ncbi:NAD(P)H-binding protein [Saccharothrix sp. Mg75]|uniref:NAD(P)H-binding protein n=1 Tax=Saccharothrix sp. Mg75 TaxID=3445357 RepID=UPI003EEB240E
MAGKPILVLGATGTTGSRVADLLDAAGHDVRRASRRGEVPFDWGDRVTWAHALTGVERVYLMAPHELPVDPDFVLEAVNRGVRRFVLLSSRAIEEMRDERLLAAEQLVASSGVDWTAVRPDWFDQNFDEGFFRESVVAGELVLPFGERRVAFVDAGDIAAVAAAALVEDGHAGRTYEVTGPEALSFPAALEEIGRVSGRRVAFRGTADDYRAVVPPEVAEAQVAAWDAWGESDVTDAVERVAGRPPKSFRAYAEDAWANGAWRPKR